MTKMRKRNRPPRPVDLDDAATRSPLVVRHKFDDGDDGVIGLDRYVAKLTGAADIAGRFFGERHGQERAKQQRATQSRDASKADRPASRSPLRQSVIDVMRPYKRDGVKLKEFLAAWEGAPIKGLTITLVGDGYVVRDENDVDDTSKPYKLGTLTKMFSEA